MPAADLRGESAAQRADGLLHQRPLLGFGQSAVMQMAHVDAGRRDLPLAGGDLLGERGIARRDRPVQQRRRAQAALIQHPHQAIDADPVAVVALGVVPVARIGPIDAARRHERRPRHIHRELRDMDGDPQRHPRLARPDGRLGLRQVAMQEPVVVEPAPAPGIVEVVRDAGAAHRRPPGVPRRQPFREDVVVMLGVPGGDLAPGRQPDAVMRHDMGERLVEGGDALRLAGEVGMERQAHHRAALRALGIELVELRLHHRRVALDRRVAVLEQRHVVDLERIGNADQPAVAHLDRHRLVVVHHVERVA